ncbi:MAG TPA: hypothetical protein VEA44_08380 [Caulobacter sp.]|nr:hypothetical protein [Caulobacter sp.]
MRPLLPALLLAALAAPAAAHEGHGLPGLAHGFSGEHLAGLLFVGAALVWGVPCVARLVRRRR